jgi:hypothetical protein
MTYSRSMTPDLLDCIVRRCDTDEDEKLNYQEFADTVKHVGLAVSQK